MDPVSKWIASVKIPIGKWGKAFFDWLTTTSTALRGHRRRAEPPA